MRNTRTMMHGWGWSTILAGAAFFAGCFPLLAQYPFSAEIESFAGRWTGAQAELIWTTGSEYGTAGFRVFRQEVKGEIPLTEGYVAADITRPFGTYALVDPTQKKGAKATYRLEELRGDGTLLTLGEWTVIFERSSSESFRLLASAPEVSPSYEIMATPVTGPAVKLPVLSNDVYSVSFASIGSVLGLTPGEAGERARQALLAMRCGDEPVAYLVDEARSRILFYGWPPVGTYTKTNIFWIQSGPGLHMQRKNPDAVPVSTNLTFQSICKFEENLSIMTERGIPRDDLYFWKSIVAGNASSGESTFAVPLDGYVSGDVAVTVHLIGWNDTLFDYDHRADIHFNGYFLGSVFFDGKEEMSALFTVPEGTVLPTGNVLNIRGILQDGHTASLFVIDAFDVEYKRYYKPASRLLLATDGGHDRISADRFLEPLVFDVTNPFLPIWVADASGTLLYGYSWPVDGQTQWAMREQGMVSPATPQPGGFGDWMRAGTNAVDYLVIAPRAFEAPAQALASYRSGMGLRTAVAFYEDICDQFADGLNTPVAIRTFLSYTHQHWTSAPWMVVLGGWGHYDYLGATTIVANFLPPLLATDSATLRPADACFADVIGDDGVPDLAIGRLPVQSVAQFNAYLAKLQAYESGGSQAWHQRMLLAADNADDGGDFSASNFDIASEAEKRYTVAHAVLDPSMVVGMRAAIRNAFVDGVGLMHYTGHGSYQQLAGENLLDVNGVNTLVNPPSPFFMSVTCLIGRFDMVVKRSLGEALVLRTGGGSLAVYAPAGLSWNNYATPYAKEFHRIHSGERLDTIGPILLKTRQSFGILSGQHADAIRTYNLFGDPALKLKGGVGGVPPAWVDNLALWRWERFSYAELSAPENSLVSIEEFVSLHGYLDIAPTNQTLSIAQTDGQTIAVVAIVPWTASVDQPWVTITGGASGTNSGTVTYSVGANTGSARSGTITISGGGVTRTCAVHQTTAIMFPANGEVLDVRRPTFTWPVVIDATGYQLWISRDGQPCSMPCMEGVNEWTPSHDLQPGNYSWWVRKWELGIGDGGWSARADFTISGVVPAKPTVFRFR